MPNILNFDYVINYSVYVKTDEKNRIIAINSSAFLDNTDGFIKIDEGKGDKYHHAQNNYFAKPIFTLDGVPRYKLAGGKAVERTDEEIRADTESLPKPQQSETEALKEQLIQTQLALTEVYEAMINLSL